MIPALYPNARLMIVDDQASNVRLLERILTNGGYSTYRSVQDARTALDAFKEFAPDLVLLDLMMPHLDGVGVLTQLRPHCEGTYLPVIILTADVGSEAKCRALAAGAKDFLTKPVDVVEVLLRINNLLETRFLYQRHQQRAERRIQNHKLLLDRTNDAILVCDRCGRILFWNPGAERLYGWQAEEAVGRDAAALLHQTAGVDLAEAERVLGTNGTWEGELKQITRSGQEIVVASRWTLTCDGQGQPWTRVIVNTDVTEKKRLEARLFEAGGNEPFEEAHVFHDLLTTIVCDSELALQALPAASPAYDLVQQVLQAGRRAEELMRGQKGSASGSVEDHH